MELAKSISSRKQTTEVELVSRYLRLSIEDAQDRFIRAAPEDLVYIQLTAKIYSELLRDFTELHEVNHG